MTLLGDEIMPLGQGQGVGGPSQGVGGVDTCQCPECGATTSHTRGTPCQTQNCPECGTPMVGMIAAIASDTLRLAKFLVAEVVQMECYECGKRFKKKIGPHTFEVKCPKCGSYDTGPA